MFRMEEYVVIQETQKTVARVGLLAFDNRSRKEAALILYVELADESESVKPYAEKALKEMGYILLGISEVETASIPFDTEVAWEKGKKSE